jgi:hypothetical protein
VQIEKIIDLLFSHNILISYNDVKLSAEAPKGAMTAELVDLIKTNKKGLVTFLMQQPEQ